MVCGQHDDMALVVYWMRFNVQQRLMALEVDIRMKEVRHTQ